MIRSKRILTTTIAATGAAFSDVSPGGAFQAVITGTGAVGCTVNIQCSLDGTNWCSLGTITLSGTTTATDGFAALGAWFSYRAVTSSVTGTVSSIVVLMSEES